MKEFTAERAREITNSSSKVERAAKRIVKEILRQVKRAAKMGDDMVVVFYKKWDSKIAERVCLELRALGYKAAPNMLRTGFIVDWRVKDNTSK